MSNRCALKSSQLSFVNYSKHATSCLQNIVTRQLAQRRLTYNLPIKEKTSFSDQS